MNRLYTLNVRNRPAAIALAAVALAVGAIFVAFGIFLLLGFAAVGTLIGSGVLLYRALTGRRAGRLPTPDSRSELDPSLEVFPREPPPDSLTR
jgi:hypothetical protein